MSANLKVVELPVMSLQDITGSLRQLIREIEAGECSDVKTFVWAILDKDGNADGGVFGIYQGRHVVGGILLDVAMKFLRSASDKRGDTDSHE